MPIDLVRELGRLVALHRRAEALLCRYLADFADLFECGRAPETSGYSDVYQAAECLFGLGVRTTRERVRIGRALRELPRIERAFEAGALSYGRVREVTRIATRRDEEHWLRRAQDLSMRELERAVVVSGGRPAAESARDLAQMRWVSPEMVEVRLRLRAEDWALVERAMEGARRAVDGNREDARRLDERKGNGGTRARRRVGGSEDDGSRRLGDWSMSDSEALGAVARDALARQTESGDASDPRRAVVLYECRLCARTELETGRGAVELDESVAATIACGAPVRDLRTEGLVVARSGPLPASVRRAVLLRDRGRCRIPGCGRRRYVDVHHIEARSRGGEHSRKNCVTLCDTHHRFLHDGSITLEGDADGEVCVIDTEGAHLTDRPPSAIALWTDRPVQSERSARYPNAMTQGGVLHPGTRQHSAHCEAVTQPGSPLDALRQAAPPDEAILGLGLRPVVAPRAAPNIDTAPPTASPAIHTAVPPDQECPANDRVSDPDAASLSDSERILHFIGARGGFWPDAISEATGLSISRVLCALLYLELEGRVRRDTCQYHPR